MMVLLSTCAFGGAEKGFFLHFILMSSHRRSCNSVSSNNSNTAAAANVNGIIIIIIKMSVNNFFSSSAAAAWKLWVVFQFDVYNVDSSCPWERGQRLAGGEATWQGGWGCLRSEIISLGGQQSHFGALSAAFRAALDASINSSSSSSKFVA